MVSSRTVISDTMAAPTQGTVSDQPMVPAGGEAAVALTASRLALMRQAQFDQVMHKASERRKEQEARAEEIERMRDAAVIVDVADTAALEAGAPAAGGAGDNAGNGGAEPRRESPRIDVLA